MAPVIEDGDDPPESTYLPLSYLGNTVNVVFPLVHLSDYLRSRIVILVKDRADYTDIAPNSGSIRIAP
jgi:hypothetical protein